MITLLVMSRYQEVFDQFLASYQQFAPYDIEHDCVLITETGVKTPPEWRVYHGPEPVIWTRTINFGVSKCRGDVFFCSDDVQFTHGSTIRMLHDISNSHSNVGALSPQFEGEVYNGLQRSGSRTGLVMFSEALCYVAIYFKVGALRDATWDERYIGTGWGEDIDHCMTLQSKGWQTAITSLVQMKHGFAGKGSATWGRRTDKMPNGEAYNQGLFMEKWRGRLDFLGPLEPLGPISVVLKQLQENK